MEDKQEPHPALPISGYKTGRPAFAGKRGNAAIREEGAGKPARHKEKPFAVPLVFCADADYGSYITVIAQSLLDNAAPEHNYHIIIFDCGIKQADLSALARQLAPHKNFQLQICDISAWLQHYHTAFNVAEGQHLSPAAYGRLLIPQLCSQYDKIIYTDIDVIFNRDPACLLHIALGENYIAGVVDTNIEKERRKRAGVKNYYRKRLGLRDDQAYINSGLLVFNSKIWRERGLVEQCLAILARQNFRRHDQDIINFICKDKIRYIGAEWNYYCNLNRSAAETMADKDKAIALYHFVGAVKPWHKPPSERGQDVLWWACARKTAGYEQFLQEAQLNKAGLNAKANQYGYSFLGLPVWRVKISPKKKKYFLFGLAVATEKLDSKKQDKLFYLLGFRLFRRRARAD